MIQIILCALLALFFATGCDAVNLDQGLGWEGVVACIALFVSIINLIRDLWRSRPQLSMEILRTNLSVGEPWDGYTRVLLAIEFCNASELPVSVLRVYLTCSGKRIQSMQRSFPIYSAYKPTAKRQIPGAQITSTLDMELPPTSTTDLPLPLQSQEASVALVQVFVPQDLLPNDPTDIPVTAYANRGRPCTEVVNLKELQCPMPAFIGFEPLQIRQGEADEEAPPEIDEYLS